MSQFDAYFKSAFTVDNVIFGFDDADLKVLLIRRMEAPYEGQWALPGYFVRQDEELDAAAERVLHEVTGLQDVFLEQVKTFGAVERHPFGRVITVAYFSLVKISNYTPRPDIKLAQEVAWFSLSSLVELAFDHQEILTVCFDRLKWMVRTRPVGFELLPPKFTLTELQHLYEAILETKLDKRNFRKKVLSMELVTDLEEMQEGVAHRPARLYSFNSAKYEQFLEEGFSFDLKESKRIREQLDTGTAKPKFLRKQVAQ